MDCNEADNERPQDVEEPRGETSLFHVHGQEDGNHWKEMNWKDQLREHLAHVSQTELTRQNLGDGTTKGMSHVEVLPLRRVQGGTEGGHDRVQEADQRSNRPKHSVRHFILGPSVHVDKDHYERGQSKAPGEHHTSAMPLKGPGRKIIETMILEPLIRSHQLIVLSG